MIAVDGEVAFVAGLCVGRMWVGEPEKQAEPWRDTGIEVRGPAVADIERAFAQAWAMTGPPLPKEQAAVTETEREICAAMAPELKRRGLLFVGIDVIGGKWLTEINVTSPTGIVSLDQFNGTDTAGLIWSAIERRLDTR
jgi:phosphatidylserine/phosphatidylglycerophosphate/cardiolipin synthase-like enzyme